MDILCKKQETADVIITIPLVINTGDPDTDATLTVKAINPDGSENTAFTAPTITEVVASGGVYKLTFSTAAANRLFTQEDTANPYTLLVKTATSGSTGYRAVRVYCTTKMPSEYATTANVTARPTLAEIEASTVLAKASVVATASAVSALPTLAAIEASSVLAKESTVSARPTLAAIEASAVIAKEATASTLSAGVSSLLSLFRNKKVVRKESSTWYLCVRNSDDTGDLLKKALKDSLGADISDLAAGVIAQELATSA